MRKFVHSSFLVLCLLSILTAAAQDRDIPRLGTVAQFGYVGGCQITHNPELSETATKDKFVDYSMGMVFSFQDYISSQACFEFITSLSAFTTNSLVTADCQKKNLKLYLPLDVRLYLGPSEDFQMYLGAGIQGNLISKYNSYEAVVGEKVTQSTFCHLAVNPTVGFKAFGAFNYRFHTSLGLRFHYPIIDGSDSNTSNNPGFDLTRDKGCITANLSLGYDLNARRTALLMFNYEMPITQGDSDNSAKFFARTQMFSLALLFRIGGSR